MSGPSNVFYTFQLSDVNIGYVDLFVLERVLTDNVAHVITIEEDSGTYTIYFSGDPLTSEQNTEIAAIVAEHDPGLVSRRLREFSDRTKELEEEGFEFPPGSGNRFSIGMKSKVLLIGMYMMKDNPAVTYPLRWNTITPGQSYEIPDVATFENFFMSAFAFAKSLEASETDLRDAVETASSPAEILAVVDNR